MAKRAVANRDKAYEIFVVVEKFEVDLLVFTKFCINDNEPAIFYFVGSGYKSFLHFLKDVEVYEWPFYTHQDEDSFRWDNFIRRLEQMRDCLLAEIDAEKKISTIGRLIKEIDAFIPAVKISLRKILSA